MPAPLKIAQVAPLWATIPPTTYGGIELLLSLLCDGLVDRGHEVTLFASGDCRSKAKLHAVIPENLNALMSRGEALVHEYYASAALADVLQRQEEFDLIHIHLPGAYIPLAATARTRCLFTLHASLHADDLWAMRRYPGVAISGISRGQLAEASGAALAATKSARAFPIVPNGVDFSAFAPSFAPGKHLAFLGRMGEEKNPLGAIQIAQAAGLPIVLAGQPQNKKEHAYFRENVEPLLDGDRVRWIGGADHAQKCALLREAAALVFPITWEEPFGLVMIEAMACGTPVLAVARGAVPEVVEEGVTGLTAATPEALADLVPQILQLDRRKVREAGEKRFGQATMVENYEALYRGMLGEVES